MEMFAFTLTEFADMLCLFHYARDFGPLYVIILYSLLLLTLCFLQKIHWSLITLRKKIHMVLQSIIGPSLENYPHQRTNLRRLKPLSFF